MKSLKIIILLFILSFIMAPCKAQYLDENNIIYYKYIDKKNKNYLNYKELYGGGLICFDLLGKVKTLTETYYNVINKFGENVSDIKGKTVIHLNEKGNVIESNSYKSDSSLVLKEINIYNEYGNVIECTRYKSDSSLNRKDLYKYDAKGNMIEYNTDYYGSQGWPGYHKIIINKYDNKGNIIDNSSYNLDGSLLSKHIYKYDIKGNMIEDCEDEHIDDSRPTKKTYKYDLKGNLIEYYGYDIYGDLREKNIYKYDIKGNIIDYSIFLYKSRNSSSNNIDYWNYNYKYNYDKTGNWVKKTIFKNGNPVFINEREIIYY